MYPLFSFEDFCHLSPDHNAFTTNILPVHEPVNYSQAKQYTRWVDAMNEELHALEINDTWELTDFPA